MMTYEDIEIVYFAKLEVDYLLLQMENVGYDRRKELQLQIDILRDFVKKKYEIIIYKVEKELYKVDRRWYN